MKPLWLHWSQECAGYCICHLEDRRFLIQSSNSLQVFCDSLSHSWKYMTKVFRQQCSMKTSRPSTCSPFCHHFFTYPWKLTIWVFPKTGVPQNGWFKMENPIKMDDLGGTPTISGNCSGWPFFRHFKPSHRVNETFTAKRCQGMAGISLKNQAEKDGGSLMNPNVWRFTGDVVFFSCISW